MKNVSKVKNNLKKSNYKHAMRYFTYIYPYYSSVTSSGFQHMARMMDSLIIDNFPPYTYTKITTHRPSRIGSTIKKSATVTNLPHTHTASATRLNVHKNKIPMQGKHIGAECSGQY